MERSGAHAAHRSRWCRLGHGVDCTCCMTRRKIQENRSTAMFDGCQDGDFKTLSTTRPTEFKVGKFDTRKPFHERLQQRVVALVLRVLQPRSFRCERKGLSDAVFAKVRYQNLKDCAILLIVDEGSARQVEAHRPSELLDARAEVLNGIWIQDLILHSLAQFFNRCIIIFMTKQGQDLLACLPRLLFPLLRPSLLLLPLPSRT